MSYLSHVYVQWHAPIFKMQRWIQWPVAMVHRAYNDFLVDVDTTNNAQILYVYAASNGRH